MGLINALVRAGKYVMTGADQVTIEEWTTIVEATEDKVLIKEWNNQRITYGAAFVNPNTLSDKMLAIYMQCITEQVSEQGKSYENTQRHMISAQQRKRIQKYDKWLEG